MTDDKSDEFRQFILDNREMIESILNEEKQSSKDPIEEMKDDFRVEVKDFNGAIMKILSDDDVQKHFIGGCMEFLNFFEAVLDAAPLSPEAREAVDKLKETKNNAVKNTVIEGTKDKIERISITEVKKDLKKKFERE